MAYPTSVFSPTARSNGQTIDASHVNDLQTEMTAVENALLGTITHSVNVSGASTLATLQAAASTFSVRPVTPPPEAALVYLQSTVTLGSSALSTIAWTGEDYVSNSSMHSTGTNPARLTPQTTGFYQFAAQVTFTPTTSGLPTIYLFDSSAGQMAVNQIGRHAADAPVYNAVLQAIAFKRFDALGGYVVVRPNMSGYSTLSMSSGLDATWFAMTKL